MPQDSAEPATSLPPVVTIFEHYGAGAETIGRKVAEALGVPFHAQAFSSEELEGGADSAIEQNAMLARVYSALGGAYGGFDGREVVATQEQKYELVMENNRKLKADAEHGGVIVGRNGAVVLADRPNTLHVLLTGTPEDRIARAAREGGIPPDRAAARQKREDKVRADMSITLYGWDPRLPDRYDLVLNTSRIAPDAAVASIVNAVRARAA